MFVTASEDGTLRIWDPILRKERLTHPSKQPYIKVSCGEYIAPGIQWSRKQNPNEAVAVIQLDMNSLRTFKSKPKRLKKLVCEKLQSSVLITSALQCAVQVPKFRIDDAYALDRAYNANDSALAKGFLYLMSDGSLLHVHVTNFDPKYVLLSDT